ncbi:MAG: hypothetical protein J6W24_05270 [Prevotella sp.]|nr:hypothetical protein [Prevotella sp.]
MSINVNKERAIRIEVTMPNGKIVRFSIDDFDDYGDCLEHKTENIILDKENPCDSCVYETDYNGEITYKDYITWQIL